MPDRPSHADQRRTRRMSRIPADDMRRFHLDLRDGDCADPAYGTGSAVCRHNPIMAASDCRNLYCVRYYCAVTWLNRRRRYDTDARAMTHDAASRGTSCDDPPPPRQTTHAVVTPLPCCAEPCHARPARSLVLLRAKLSRRGDYRKRSILVCLLFLRDATFCSARNKSSADIYSLYDHMMNSWTVWFGVRRNYSSVAHVVLVLMSQRNISFFFSMYKVLKPVVLGLMSFEVERLVHCCGCVFHF